MTDIIQRYDSVRARIAAACRDAGREPDSVTLVVITKTYGAEAIEPLLALGHRVFGENRVQEAKLKWPSLRARYPGVELHLVGPLQSNKAAEAVELFDCLHSIDRIKIAEALATEMRRSGKSLELFAQVNTGSEPQKAGILPEQSSAIVEQCQALSRGFLSGLMCIPPADAPPSPHFALLGQIARRHGLTRLSMGMSADFPQAIMLGATHIRIGSAIMGLRE